MASGYDGTVMQAAYQEQEQNQEQNQKHYLKEKHFSNIICKDRAMVSWRFLILIQILVA